MQKKVELSGGEKKLERLAYSVSDLAEMSGISERTLWEQIHLGLIPHARVGRRVIVTVDQWQTFILARSSVPKIYSVLRTRKASRKTR